MALFAERVLVKGGELAVSTNVGYALRDVLLKANELGLKGCSLISVNSVRPPRTDDIEFILEGVTVERPGDALPRATDGDFIDLGEKK
jgi:hypothetical protein